MTRFLYTALLITSIIGFLAAGPARADSDTISLTPIKASEHVYYFQGASGMATRENKAFMSNAGFVVTPDGVVAFDSLGTPALGQAMLDAIAKVTKQPVKQVIISHYHADHYYGLQAFKAAGVDIRAHKSGQAILADQDETQERLAQRRTDLSPWVNDQTVLTPADRWLDFADGDTIRFSMGDVQFQLINMAGAHSPGDIMLYVDNDRVLFSGDLYFSGRIPYVGDADSKTWLKAMDRMLDLKPVMVIPGHGPASTDTIKDMQLTRNYLLYLRKTMGEAVENMTDFETAYKDTDWSQFKDYPAFNEANRLNAFGQYLVLEHESLAQ
ncbi:MAG: MBL fold metallo-hydrolase [Castellaniella sp.]